jgi:hypothetical protein
MALAARYLIIIGIRTKIACECVGIKESGGEPIAKGLPEKRTPKYMERGYRKRIFVPESKRLQFPENPFNI